MFNGRRLLIVTKHQKEKVIAPLLEKELGVKCMVTENFDTDVLGTFTGEIERVHDPVTTARNKCHMAMELSDCDLAIASEGSFTLFGLTHIRTKGGLTAWQGACELLTQRLRK